jgi:hypothetical protein
MESQHRAILATVARIVDPETIAHRDRSELISACRTLADWLKQYVEMAAEQSAEIKRLSSRPPGGAEEGSEVASRAGIDPAA